MRALSVPRNLTLSGLVVAGVGFLLTRFTVTLAAYDDATTFYFAGLVPLVLGLLLAAFGVALVVGSFEPAFVRTTAVWCLVGLGAMSILVVLTLLGSDSGGSMDSVLSKTYLSNFLIGGSIGGTLTGMYAARTERQRGELQGQANRLVTLNRILRHEVLNSMTAISGYADVLDRRDGDVNAARPVEVIQRRSDDVVSTIEDVQYLTESGRAAETTLSATDLISAAERSVESVRERHPNAEYVLGDGLSGEVPVRANGQLRRLLDHLLENAVEHSESETPRVEVDVAVDRPYATIRIADDGPGLPEVEQSILEDGTVTEHDDPSSGFGINVARLLVERFGGEVETTVTDAGTTIEVRLLRAPGASSTTAERTAGRAYGIEPSRLALAVGVSLVAGGAMGAFSQGVAGAIPVIGALYGVSHPVVGWVTHEFHSVVFGMAFAGLLAAAPNAADGPRGYVLGAVAWGVALWAVAAGVVMPLWLRFVGIESSVPNLQLASLASHLVWGVSLGALYYAGIEWLDGRRQ